MFWQQHIFYNRNQKPPHIGEPYVHFMVQPPVISLKCFCGYIYNDFSTVTRVAVGAVPQNNNMESSANHHEYEYIGVPVCRVLIKRRRMENCDERHFTIVDRLFDCAIALSTTNNYKQHLRISTFVHSNKLNAINEIGHFKF